jgi:MFS family permease
MQSGIAMHKQRWVLMLAAAASFMVSLDALVVTTALPTIRHELGASLSSLEWTVNAYTLSFAVLLMSAAALGDRYCRRRMFSFGVALFRAASVGCALAPSVGAFTTTPPTAVVADKTNKRRTRNGKDRDQRERLARRSHPGPDR